MYLAEHIPLGQLRVIKQTQKSSPRWKELLCEAQLMKQFYHPCIPVIYDIEEDKEQLSIIEQYIPGESLFSYCLKQHLQTTEILSFIIQLCDLVEYLHCREMPILHLDLKPENLKLHEGKLYVLDFGSAVLRKDIPGAKPLTGTPGFCAPECYRGEATERSDLYSVGKILEFMLEHSVSEKRLIARSGQYQREERLRKSLNRIVTKGTREKPEQRYADVREMKRALTACVQKQTGEGKLHQPTSIAVAGCSRRCGTTYVALLLAGYFRRMGRQVLYLECNESNQVLQLCDAIKESDEEEGYHGIRLAESRYFYGVPDNGGSGWHEEEEQLHRKGYSVIIRDYGSIGRENLTYVRQADEILLVGGCNDWELESLWRGVKLFSAQERKRWKLLLNFGNLKRAEDLDKAMRNIACYRLPLSHAVPDKLTGEWFSVFREMFD